ncbi:MAG: SDR family NAD(P)-dependent oxidoreductase, partial [Victivallaceae bacterium]
MCCDHRLDGKVALVTGGARGIGKAICTRLAQEGAALAIVDIMLDVAQKTADEFVAQGVNAKAYAANVAKFEDAEATVSAVVNDFGKLDILVNNAGITRDTLILRMTEQDWDAVLAVNLKGTFNFTKAACRPMMKAHSGKIVNIASVVGRMGNAGQANYSASKGGVIALTKTTAKEFAARNIQANAVAPGYIVTDMTGKLSEAATDAFLTVIPA